MTVDSLLCVHGVTRTFVSRTFRNLLGLEPTRVIRALDDVSFSIAPGQVTALLGPNGAGKTTLVNVICDLVRADHGSVTVCGLAVPAQARQARRKIGLVTTNERSFFWRLTGRQNLEFFGALYDLPRPRVRRLTDELLDRFGLSEHANRLFRTYSAGMKKRLGLARALLHDPPVLLMDEPTSSLDAAGTEDLLNLVRTQIVAEGKCVLWATHLLEEVTKLCDRVIVLTAGRIRLHSSIGKFMELYSAHAGYRIELTFPAAKGEPIDRLARSFGGALEAAEGKSRISLPSVYQADRLSGILRQLLDMGATISMVEPVSASLSQVFDDLNDGSEATSSVSHEGMSGGL